MLRRRASVAMAARRHRRSFDVPVLGGLRLCYGTGSDGGRRVHREMKALVYTAPEALDYRDVPDPAPGSDHHLIRIDSVGICGSDMHAYLGHDDRRPAPLILGHEGAGTIVGARWKDAGSRSTPWLQTRTARPVLRGVKICAPPARSSQCLHARVRLPSSWRSRNATWSKCQKGSALKNRHWLNLSLSLGMPHAWDSRRCIRPMKDAPM